MLVAMIGFSVRVDLLGVTSIVRSLGLKEACYDRILDFFHSPALNLETLTRVWTSLVLKFHPGLLRCNGRVVLAGDGIKVGKTGKKMPAVKRLHQESGTNGKPPYIMGHSCQCVCILARGLQSVAAIPLAARIHEGVVFSNRDQRTLLDKMIQLLDSLTLDTPFYFVADAYYASRKIASPLLEKGNHLVTRVRKNAVAYLPPPPHKSNQRGRRKTYGEKVALMSLFGQPETMPTMNSPVYGEKNIRIRFRTCDLLWRPMGVMVRFLAVEHPTRGRCILMTTDLTLDPADIVRLYGYRFKIELTFKKSLHVLGAFLYHFWMAAMTPIGRKSGNQYLHRKSDAYRQAVKRKLDAYHRFMQVGLISQGIMLTLATTMPQIVWQSFGSWLRTMRPDVCPSELVVAIALRNNLPDFLADESIAPELTKFLRQRLDMTRTQALRLAA
jgi:hypothetical protein